MVPFLSYFRRKNINNEVNLLSPVNKLKCSVVQNSYKENIELQLSKVTIKKLLQQKIKLKTLDF